MLASCICLLLLTAHDRFVIHNDSQVAGQSVLFFQPVPLYGEPTHPVHKQLKASSKAHFGHLPLGTHVDHALALIWDPDADEGPVLWLDANGDGQLSPTEKYSFSNKELLITVTVRFQFADETSQAQRTLVIRRSSLSDGLQYAIRGYVRGNLTLGSNTFSAVLVDANGDGCFHTAGVDRVWIDFNRDQRFDPISEQFYLGRPIMVDQVAYIVTAEPDGVAVQARPRSHAKGKANLKLPYHVIDKVDKFQAVLVDEVGEAITVSQPGQATTVPAGRYRFASLSMSIADDQGLLWNYHFSGWSDIKHHVKPDATTDIPVLTKCILTLTHNGQASGVKPGEVLNVRPLLFDPCGLYAININKGQPLKFTGTFAEFWLLDHRGKQVAAFVSQFH